MTRFEGSEIRYTAANAAYRDFVGRSAGGQAAAGRVRKLPPSEHTMEEAPDVPGRLRARGVVDTTTAAELDARLRQATWNGIRSMTVDLSGLSHLASAGVQTLHHLRDLVERNGQGLSLYAPAGSPAQASAWSLSRTPRTTRPTGRGP